jgi:hypothetical protein
MLSRVESGAVVGRYMHVPTLGGDSQSILLVLPSGVSQIILSFSFPVRSLFVLGSGGRCDYELSVLRICPYADTASPEQWLLECHCRYLRVESWRYILALGVGLIKPAS